MTGDAVIVERRLIADLVIDTMTGERITAKTHPVTRDSGAVVEAVSALVTTWAPVRSKHV